MSDELKPERVTEAEAAWDAANALKEKVEALQQKNRQLKEERDNLKESNIALMASMELAKIKIKEVVENSIKVEVTSPEDKDHE